MASVADDPTKKSRGRLPRRSRCRLGVALSVAIAVEAGAQASPEPAPDIAFEETTIPMADGVRLSVDLWRPRGGPSSSRFPVLLEYLPYRKAESRGGRFDLYAYFVRRGYVVARVDIRGTGTSEGTLIPHEYSDIEQADGDQVIAWLARQPFADGNVGMFGISWGGFNAIQMAMRRPPALKAIIAVDATDELYQDDVHFMDGMMHVDSWEMSQDLSNAMPGAPGYVIDEKYFAERFDQPPWFLTYKRQQRDGPFWDRASLKRDYRSIVAPTFLIGGWYDGYRDAIPRMMARMSAPVKAMIGPWTHTFPHDGGPGAAIEWRDEAVRWFDQWLKGRETGIMREPRLSLFVRGWHPPGPVLDSVPGIWRTEAAWPVAAVRQETWFPSGGGGFGRAIPPAGNRQLSYVPSTGVEAGGPVMWFGDVPPDLRPSDAFGLNFESEPLRAPLEILGLPRALLQVSASATQAHWFARLSDVAPDGRVTLVASAGQNGAHRRSARSPEPLVIGERFPLEIEMHATSWVFPKGHRIRFTVSNAQWPMIWPTPFPMTTSLYLGRRATRVMLPVVPAGYHRPTPRWPAIAKTEPPLPGYQWLDTGTASGYGEIESIDRNPATGVTRVVATSRTLRRLPWGTEENTESITHEVGDRAPHAASVKGEYATIVALPDRTLRWQATVTVRSDSLLFHYEHVRKLLQDGRLIRERRWTDRIPRDHQ